MATSSEKSPMRICYIWQYASADKHLDALSATALHSRAVIEGFKRRGHSVRMISFRAGRPQYSDDLITWHPIQVRAFPTWFRLLESAARGVQGRLRLPYFNLFDSYKFARVCLESARGCDVIYERFWMLASGGGMMARRLKIPILYEVNGDLVEEYQQQQLKLPKAHWAAIHVVTRSMYRSAGKVIAVSEILRDRLQKRYRLDDAKICAIENGADVERFSAPRAEEVEAARKRYGLAGGAVITFVGTFKPWHGIDLLIRSFHAILPHFPGIKLLLVGDGPLRPELEGQARELGLADKVIFTGAVPHNEVPALLAAADIAVLNPKVSGASQAQSPLKLFEYMASGKAVVAPKIANYERILKHRETGYFAAEGEQSLKEALTSLLENEALRKKLGQAAARQALEIHSWDATVSKIEAIMHDLMPGRNAESSKPR